jgi:hypothetical protein
VRNIAIMLFCGGHFVDGQLELCPALYACTRSLFYFFVYICHPMYLCPYKCILLISSPWIIIHPLASNMTQRRHIITRQG